MRPVYTFPDCYKCWLLTVHGWPPSQHQEESFPPFWGQLSAKNEGKRKNKTDFVSRWRLLSDKTSVMLLSVYSSLMSQTKARLYLRSYPCSTLSPFPSCFTGGRGLSQRVLPQSHASESLPQALLPENLTCTHIRTHAHIHTCICTYNIFILQITKLRLLKLKKKRKKALAKFTWNALMSKQRLETFYPERRSCLCSKLDWL